MKTMTMPPVLKYLMLVRILGIGDEGESIGDLSGLLRLDPMLLVGIHHRTNVGRRSSRRQARIHRGRAQVQES